jgi:hypothetical protein
MSTTATSKTQAEISALFDQMFYQPENFIEREIFVAAYPVGEAERTLEAYRERGEYPEAAVAFCLQRLNGKKK